MSEYSEYWLSYMFPESVEAGLPSFEPTDPDSFERDFEGQELDNLDPASFQALSTPPLPYSDVSTPSSLTSLSGSMVPTELTDDATNSDYSVVSHSTSSYQTPPALRAYDFGSPSIGVDPKYTSTFHAPAVYTDPDTSGDLDSFGTLELPPDFFDALQVKAPLDDGPYGSSVGISPDSLYTATQGAAFPPPMDIPVGAALTEQSNTGPIRKQFICPECGHLSARKHNLKTHMETHNPNRTKPFVCPESECGHPFTRKHDLKRHLESMHGDHPE